MKILEVKDISVKLGGVSVLENVSFDVNEGEIILILGPNGSGKTTLLRAIAGLLPFTGNIIWNSEKSHKIGFVPQDFEFQRNFPLKVKELFAITLDIKDEKKIHEYLEFSKAGHLEDKRLGELSGGELQRTIIAFVLAQEPNVLLFDEPFSGIDIGSEETIYQHLKHIVKSKKLTVIMVSHDLSVVFRLADRIICLNKTIRCIGCSKDIKENHLEDLYGGEIALFEHLQH